MSGDFPKILITGANGFIGINLCPVFKDRAEIRAALRSEAEVPDLPPFVSPVVVGSISRDTKWEKALDGIDVVIHLAARVRVRRERSQAPLAEFRNVNTYGTEALARAAVTIGVKRLVYLSSIKVNGERTELDRPFTETDPVSPQDRYAVSKVEAERALMDIAEKSALEVVIIRPPIIYGPNVKANFLTLMKLVDRAIPLPTRYIDNLRSFLYVGNLADFVIRCIDHPAAVNQIFLLSDGFDISTPQLIAFIARAMDKPDRQFPFPRTWARTGAKLVKRENIYSRLWESLRIDSSTARKRLDWCPPFPLTIGIEAPVERFVRWHKRIE